MESNYLIMSGNALAEMRMRIESMILLYEEDALVLLELAAEQKLYHAAGALDAIASAARERRRYPYVTSNITIRFHVSGG